jgi:hypothetical protein
VLYATAETVLPSSSYSLSQLPPSCQGNEADCATASPPLVVTTERWTNVDCSNSNNGVPNASDLARVVDKIKEWPGSFIEPRLHIRAPLLDGMTQVNAQDAGRAVDAVKGLQYPFSIKCTTSTACVANAECVSPATCSANGWCTMVKDPCSGLCQP